LTSDWESAQPQRALADGRLADLHPLSELQHPIIAKAANSFGADAAEDNFVGPIASSTRLRLLEIKQSQWRGGVWEDPETRVCWLVVSGLAKGGHQDRDDFYKRIERENQSGDPTQWLPTDSDIRLLKQETAARLRTEWELETQQAVLDALRVVHVGGSQRIDISHPVPDKGAFAHIDLTVAAVREDGYEADEVLVEIVPETQYAGSALLWQLTVRVLISIEPPEQRWDRFGDTYSNIGEPGAWTERVSDLEMLVQAGELAVSEPGSTSHYAHREHLAGKTINGEAVRGLCGAYFVPTQDHEALPPCPTCQERLAELPK
jgi:Protein of unknown function (DUF3039)